MRRFVIALPFATYRTFSLPLYLLKCVSNKRDIGTAMFDGHDSNSLKKYEETHT